MPPSHTSPAVSTVFSTFHQNDDSDIDDDYWTKKGKGAILDPPVPFLVPNCHWGFANYLQIMCDLTKKFYCFVTTPFMEMFSGVVDIFALVWTFDAEVLIVWWVYWWCWCRWLWKWWWTQPVNFAPPPITPQGWVAQRKNQFRPFYISQSTLHSFILHITILHFRTLHNWQ